MYLYDKKEDKIDIYDLIPSLKDIYEYRMEQMKKIPEDKMVIRGITGTGIDGYEIFKNYENKFYNEIIPIENVNGSYHKLESDPLNGKGKNKEILLDSYYFGHLSDRKIARISDLNKIRYLLLKQTQYRYYFKKAILEEIIEIPESLYLLSLIEQQKFSLIEDRDISEQLNLFKLEQTKGIDLDTIIRMDYIGMTPGCYSKVIEKAENDAHILKLIKK